MKSASRTALAMIFAWAVAVESQPGGLPPAVSAEAANRAEADDKSAFITKATSRKSDDSGQIISGEAVLLLKRGTRQPATVRRDLCTLRSPPGKPAAGDPLRFWQLPGGCNWCSACPTRRAGRGFVSDWANR